MSRDHSLRPDRYAENLDRSIGMKQHPDRQPRRAVAMHRRDDDDSQTDQDFESDWTDVVSFGATGRASKQLSKSRLFEMMI